ncbi:hypothetical protein FIBSPDRAFT_860470 [Athelia psychrophila]|uniref:Uncharacterized protein n=1 Tax=Athelia psychrophila TaxID=1759441 RepID=A0A166K4T6_9AGAM|nr:hypothetical protein FIBSPDRAFT_860470 [Fibularhizoctonia sp. CBS 109695]
MVGARSVIEIQWSRGRLFVKVLTTITRAIHLEKNIDYELTMSLIGESSCQAILRYYCSA